MSRPDHPDAEARILALLEGRASMSHAEIAKVLHLPITAVVSTLSILVRTGKIERLCATSQVLPKYRVTEHEADE